MALPAQDKAARRYKNHSHGLINGRILIYIYEDIKFIILLIKIVINKYSVITSIIIIKSFRTVRKKTATALLYFDIQMEVLLHDARCFYKSWPVTRLVKKCPTKVEHGGS
jgi:hypothetical protein